MNMQREISLANEVERLMSELTRWRSHIDEALQHAEYSHGLDDVTAMVLKGHLQLHSFEASFALTQIIIWPKFKALHLFVVGGDLQDIISRKEQFQAIAREHDCSILSFSGRPGWKRVLAQHGWREKFVTMWTGV